MDNISVVSNSRCRPLVQSCVPFRGSNLFADTQANGIYVVWSYGFHFPLFAKVGDQWYENDDRFSNTTSKQRGQAHPHTETIKVGCVELKTIIER